MKIIDISWPLTEKMTQYKDVECCAITQTTNTTSGAMETHIGISSHTGTHVDAPAHFIADGKTIDQLPLEHLIGTCRVLDLTTVQEKITHTELAVHNIRAQEIIVLKTTNSFISATDRFNHSFVYLTHEGANYLVQQKIKALGFDYLGIERNKPDHPTHKTLMLLQIPIIEGLRLAHVDAGTYTFYCLPILLPGCDAAPARAILIQN